MHQGSSSKSSDESCKLQLKAYAKFDANLPETDRIPVMVSITAPPSGLMAEQREPVDIVVVLHVRKDRTVPEKWKELLMEAVKVIVKKLDHKDCLSIVPVQSTLLPMSATNKEVASAAVSKAIIRSDTSVLRDLESAESILYGRRYEDKDRRVGYIIVISNSNDDIDSLFTWSFRSVHTFGFRDSHNARAMHSIASSRDCTYAILDDEHGQITKALATSIDRITSAMPIEVIFKCEQQVVLSTIDAPRISYFISQDKKVGMMWGSAHLAGVATNFVIYLDNLYLRLDQHDNLTKLFTVQVKYGHVSDKLDVQVVAVKKGTNGSKEVAAEMVRIEALKIVDDIVAEDKKDWEHLHAAADELHERWTKLKNSDCGKEAGEAGLISVLTAEMQEMEIRLYNDYLWLEYMLSWQSHQRWQLPLPQLFMDKQATHESLLQLRIFAKVDPIPVGEPITQHQQGLPVLLHLMAPEAGLAMAKRASVDLIIVLDVEKETHKLELLIKAMDVMQREIHELELLIKPLIKAMDVMQREIHELELLIKPAMVVDMNNLTDLAKIEKKKKTAMAMKLKTDIEKKKTDIDNKRTDMEKKKTDMEKKKTDMEKKKTEKTDMEKKIHKKREPLIKAMDVVMEKLSHKDRLAIIPIKASIDEPAARLLEMCKQGRSETSAMVRKLLTAWSNNMVSQTSHRRDQMRDQIKKGVKVIRKCLHITPGNSPFPTPTSPKSQSTASTTQQSVALGGTTNLWKALTDATKILDGRPGEDQKTRVGFIIVISDRDGQSIGPDDSLISPNYITHAFGFVDNDAHSARAMHYIASSSKGIYAMLNNDRGQISEPFMECIKKITSTVAIDAKVDIKCSDSATVAAIVSGQFRSDIDDGGKSASILAGGLYAGTVRNFIVYVDCADTSSKLLTVHVNWGDGHVERKGVEGAEEVVAAIARIEAAKIVREITDPNYDKKLLSDMVTYADAVKMVSEILERKKEKIISEHQDHPEYGTDLLMEKLSSIGSEITDPSYVKTLVAVMLQNMCDRGGEKARAAGEAWLAREMEEMKDNLKREVEKVYKDVVRSEITNPYYLQKLVEERLPYMLSWLSFQM